MKRGTIGHATQMHSLLAGVTIIGTGWFSAQSRKRAMRGYAPVKNKGSHQQPSRKPVTLAPLPPSRSA